MEKAIKEQYSDQILNELLGRYGIDKNSIKLLDGFESYIYEFGKGGNEYILRVSHTGLRRSKEQILAEVDFINYLADLDVPAARALPSPAGKLVETSDVSPLFSAVVFEKAQGGPPQRHHWVPSFFEKYGETMGKMHRLTKEYKPTNPGYKRPGGMDDLIGFAEKFLPSSEVEVIAEWNNALDYLQKLPRGRNEYGLIHQDLHGGNFFLDDKGNMTIFDFDDSQYFWFSHDIAMALFYVVPHDCVKKEDLDNAQTFYSMFMEGYRRENQLDVRWIKEIPTFLQLRQMDLYIAIHRSMDMNDLDSWCVSFMHNRKEKIIKRVPYVDIRFD